MALRIVNSSAETKADYIMLYGIEGIGKSTWSKKADKPLYLDTEGRLRYVGVPSVRCEDYSTAVAFLKDFPVNEYKTAVIDTADALDGIIQSKICRAFGWESIESPGYGKGYVALSEAWREFLVLCDALRDRGIEIHFIAHAMTKLFSNPAGPDYTRYQPKMHDKVSSLIKEKCDFIFFAAHEEDVEVRKGATKEGMHAKGKGTATGARIIHTFHTPAWDAKRSVKLPDVLALDYAEFATAREQARAAKLGRAPESVKPQAETANPPSSTTSESQPAPALGAQLQAELDLDLLSKVLGEYQKDFKIGDTRITKGEFVTPMGVNSIRDLPPTRYPQLLDAVRKKYDGQKKDYSIPLRKALDLIPAGAAS